MPDYNEAELEKDYVSTKSALKMYWGIMIFGMVISMPSPLAIVGAPLFPLGLAEFFPKVSDAATKGIFLLCYMIHFFLFCTFLRVHSRRAYNWAVLVLIIVTILNVEGCHRHLGGLSSIT